MTINIIAIAIKNIIFDLKFVKVIIKTLGFQSFILQSNELDITNPYN